MLVIPIYILRKSVNLSKQTHIIAANIDQALLVITLDSPVTTTGFIDRFLVAAKAYGVEVVLCFNKLDLLDDELQVKQKSLQKMYENIGYSCISTSLIKNDVSAIKSFMQDKTYRNIFWVFGNSMDWVFKSVPERIRQPFYKYWNL